MGLPGEINLPIFWFRWVRSDNNGGMVTRGFLQRSMKWVATTILVLVVTPVADSAEQLQRFRNSNIGVRFAWSAHHESGDFSEYFWRHADTACGWLVAVPDPTASGRGYVSESQIY